MRQPTVYRAVRLKDSQRPDGSWCWGIKGAWKTINSTMGLYQSQAEAERAIERMTVARRVVTVRQVRRA